MLNFNITHIKMMNFYFNHIIIGFYMHKMLTTLCKCIDFYSKVFILSKLLKCRSNLFLQNFSCTYFSAQFYDSILAVKLYVKLSF